LNAAAAFVFFVLAGPGFEKPLAINPEAVESFQPADCPYKSTRKDCVWISYRGKGGSTVVGTFEEVASKLTGKPVDKGDDVPPSIFQKQAAPQ